MSTHRKPIASAMIALLCFAGSASAEDRVVAAVGTAVGPGASFSLGITPEQRLREDLRVLLLDMVQTGAFGETAPEKIALSIEEPRQRVGNLGVLVDSASGERARDGLRVLGTTPGSSAERMGLRAGDVIVAINGRSLAGLGSGDGGSARAASVLRDHVSDTADGAPLAFDVHRAGQTLAISGALAATWIPAVRLTIGEGSGVAATAATSAGSCGRISIFDVAPRQEKLHAATLNSIDGELAGVQGQTSFRVSAGEHVLEIGERIENQYLTINDRQRNNAPRYKSLTVHVQPDTTYFVAARLVDERRNEWKDGAYWEPVVWRESAERCR